LPHRSHGVIDRRPAVFYYSISLLSPRLLRAISPGSAAVTRMIWVTGSESRSLPTTRFVKVALLASIGPISMPCTSARLRLAHTYSCKLLMPSERQRSHWSTIARAFPGTSISIIVFDTPYHVSTGPANGPKVTDSRSIFTGLCFSSRTT
jgi:hypothetical protein